MWFMFKNGYDGVLCFCCVFVRCWRTTQNSIFAFLHFGIFANLPPQRGTFTMEQFLQQHEKEQTQPITSKSHTESMNIKWTFMDLFVHHYSHHHQLRKQFLLLRRIEWMQWT